MSGCDKKVWINRTWKTFVYKECQLINLKKKELPSGSIWLQLPEGVQLMQKKIIDKENCRGENSVQFSREKNIVTQFSGTEQK